MNHNEHFTRQLTLLQRDISDRQSRLFWIVVIGLLVLPFLGSFLLNGENRSWAILPLSVLAMIVLFLAQQGQLMQAGQRLGALLEGDIESSPDEAPRFAAHTASRFLDRHSSGCLIVIFFAYYFVSVALVLYRLWTDALEDPSRSYWTYFFGAAGVYTITTIWGLAALVRHLWSFTNSSSEVR